VITQCNSARAELQAVRLDEPAPAPASPGRYQHEHTRAWADTIASFDGFVMVSPEYNHSIPGVLKNAIDYLYAEWNNKAVGFVSYGGVGGARAVEQLWLICGALQMADVAPQVTLSLLTEFENYTIFKPGDHNVTALDTLLDQVVTWSTALAPLPRSQSPEPGSPSPANHVEPLRPPPATLTRSSSSPTIPTAPPTWLAVAQRGNLGGGPLPGSPRRRHRGRAQGRPRRLIQHENRRGRRGTSHSRRLRRRTTETTETVAGELVAVRFLERRVQ
jgi:NAD(P)H-dependent FMN reductase